MKSSTRSCTGPCARRLPPSAYAWRNRQAGTRQARCKQCSRATRKEYTKRDRTSGRQHRNNYTARCQTLGRHPGDPEAVTIAFLIERDGDKCIDCGSDWTEVEHVQPIVYGGAHTADNLALVCHPCNVREFQEWQQLAELIEHNPEVSNPADLTQPKGN